MTKVLEAHVLRVALETEVVRRLADDGAPAAVAQSRTMIDLQRQVGGERQQLQLFQELDEHFHAQLFRQLGLENLHTILRSRAGHLDRVRRLQTHSAEKIRSIINGHVAIIDAIEAGDAAAAMTAARLHLDKPANWADTYRKQHPDYFV